MLTLTTEKLLADLISFHSAFLSKEFWAQIQTDLQDPGIDVFTNHVTCDTRGSRTKQPS